MNEPAILISDNTGSALLGVSRATWWRRVHDGTLPQPIKLGGVTRWRRDEIEAVIDAASAARNPERDLSMREKLTPERAAPGLGSIAVADGIAENTPPPPPTQRPDRPR